MPTPITGQGVWHILFLAIVLMATPWNKINQILPSRNYVYMFVDLENNQEHNNKH